MMKHVPPQLTQPFNAEAVEASLYEMWGKRVNTFNQIT